MSLQTINNNLKTDVFFRQVVATTDLGALKLFHFSQFHQDTKLQINSASSFLFLFSGGGQNKVNPSAFEKQNQTKPQRNKNPTNKQTHKTKCNCIKYPICHQMVLAFWRHRSIRLLSVPWPKGKLTKQDMENHWTRQEKLLNVTENSLRS